MADDSCITYFKLTKQLIFIKKLLYYINWQVNYQDQQLEVDNQLIAINLTFVAKKLQNVQGVPHTIIGQFEFIILP